jgi:uncharacterized protein (DUF58 family)
VRATLKSLPARKKVAGTTSTDIITADSTTADSTTADIASAIARVRRLKLVARKNAAGLLRGNYQTAVRGQGLIFHESRKYVAGEPARSIDWNITARVGEPHVRVHLEERQREVIIALDVSPSMHVGYGHKSKLELAVELAATLAVSATESGDRLGHVLFADRVLETGRPRAGQAQLFRTLRALLDHTTPWTRPVAESDPRSAIHSIEQSHRGRLVIFLISDFIDHDLPDDLRFLRPRHDVTLLHVYDPFEMAKTPEVVFRGFSPEARGRPVPLNPGATGDLAAMQDFLRQRCGEHRLGFSSFATNQDVGTALGRLFHQRRKSRRS